MKLANAGPGQEAAAHARVRTVLRSVAGALLGLTVAGVVIWRSHVALADVAHHIAEAPLWTVALAVGSGFVNLALQALRWHAVIGPLLGLGYADALRAQIVGFMFNQIVPARGGDLLRVQYLGRRTGKSRATILGTEIVDRWLDFWGWIPTVLVLALTGGLPAWVARAMALFGALLAVWALTMVALTRRGRRIRLGTRFAAIDVAFRAGVEAFRARRTWLAALIVAPLPWLWEAMIIRVVLRGFGVELGIAQAFCVLLGFNLAMVVPSPGGVGTVETGGAAALAFFGVDLPTGLAFMAVYHAAQLFPGVVAGIAILVAQRERLFGD